VELGALVPKMLAVGKNNREVHALVGKWAYNTGDSELAQAELALADTPIKKTNSKPLAKSDEKPEKKPAVASGKKKPQPPKASGAKKPAVKPKTKPQPTPKAKAKTKTLKKS